MHNLPFDKPGRFWRGNLHTHTTRSDGRLSAEDVCRTYRENGYHFIALTDHFMERYSYPVTDASAFSTPDFVTLTGAELHAGMTRYSGLWHLLAVGLPLDFAPPEASESGAQISARALAAGAYVAVAHPAWYNLCEADVIALGAVHAIEVYNGISADHNDRADSWYMLDTLVAQGYRYTACATDDTHFNPRHADLMRGWVYVRSETLAPDALLTALKAGHYYSSTGAQIHDIRLEGERLIVRCSPAATVFVTGKGSLARQHHGNGITSVEFDLARFDSPYARVTVRGADGSRAWSNPFWFSDAQEAHP